MSRDINNFKDELLLKTYEQFSLNQNNKQNIFLKTLGFLGLVIFAYAFVYREFLNYDIDLVSYSYMTTASLLLLGGGAWLIVTLAYSFRRDQFIVSNIKKHYNLIDYKSTYPLDYNPLTIYIHKNSYCLIEIFAQSILQRIDPKDRADFKFVFIRWMPDVFVIYYHLFPIFIVFILIVYCKTVYNYGLHEFYNSFWIVLFLMLLNFIVLFLILYLPLKYSKKLFKRLLVWNGIIAPYDPKKDNQESWNRKKEILSQQ